jgi:hypothetical protein
MSKSVAGRLEYAWSKIKLITKELCLTSARQQQFLM